jgi:ribosome-associated toxin RatA of RatAB toxin-antitoxin module
VSRDAVEVSTVVYLPPEAVYEFLVDFPRYANYSKHLAEVRQRGDGDPGTVYDLVFTWWKIRYTARSRVESVDPPDRIDWRIVKDIDAAGYWAIEEVPEEVPPDRETASRVVFHVDFHPESVDSDAISLPTFVNLSWVIERVKPKIQAEAERVVRRIVADLEGEPRDVELEIRSTPDTV